MIPGPYSICHISMPEDSDAAIYTTLLYGYDTAEDAYKKLEQVAADNDVPAEDCCVIRFIDREEATEFNS